MRKWIIDTNTLISFITDRNPERQIIAAKVFKDAARLNCKIYCHQHVISELVYLMESVYKVDKI